MPGEKPPLEAKSPKAPRRVKTLAGDPNQNKPRDYINVTTASQPHASRRVHFGDLEQTTAGQTFEATKDQLNLHGGPGNPTPTPPAAASIIGDQAKAAATPSITSTNQPTSYPALVPPSGVAPGPWYTSLHPNQSLGAPQSFPQPHSQLHFHHQCQNQPQQVTFITSHPATMAGEYAGPNPPVMGVSFQPPVPDTTHGPMNHVYIPRFDNGIVGGAGPVPLQQQPNFTQIPLQQQYIVQPQPQVHHAHVQAQIPAQLQGQPYYLNQPPLLVNGQPQMMAGPGPQIHGSAPAFVQPGPAIMVNPPGLPIGTPIGPGQTPDIAGIGRTGQEETIRQLNFAHANRMFDPQDFKPSDDDPSRFYYVRELDGNWTQRNRFTIDHMGDCRWYVTDEGWFYAVRLPN